MICAIPQTRNTTTFLLCAALLTGAEAQEAFQIWQSTVDLDRLPPDQFALLPLLYRNLERLGIDHPWLPRLKGVYRRAWYANQLALRSLAGVSGALDAEGIPLLIVGGAALAQSQVAEMALRPIPMMEIIVPVDAADAALHRLTASGWRSRPPFPAPHHPGSRRWIAGQYLVNTQGQAVYLGWHVLTEIHSATIDAEFQVRAVPVRIEQISAQTLDPTGHLLRTCLAVADGGLIRLADAALLIRQADIDWPWLLAMSQQHRLGPPLAQVLGTLAKTLAVAIPAALLEELRQQPVCGYEQRAWRAGLIPPTQRNLVQRFWRHYARYRRTVECLGLRSRPIHWVRFVRQTWNLARIWGILNRFSAPSKTPPADPCTR